MSDLGSAVLAEHASRLGGLEESVKDLRSTLDDLTRTAAALDQRVGKVATASARHAVRISALEDASRKGRKTTKDGGEAYEPIPAVRWWATEGEGALTSEEAQAAITRLRTWVDGVYKPMYGHAAARLPDCWPQHALCLITLDWLSELWSVLYLADERDARTLAAQADFGTRIVQAAAALLNKETSQCDHRRNTP